MPLLTLPGQTSQIANRLLANCPGAYSDQHTTMARPTIDELLAAIRQLTLAERRSLIERATLDADQDTLESAE